MLNSKVFLGLAAGLFGLILIASAWLVFFPSRSQLQLAVMLALWLCMTLPLMLLVVRLNKGKRRFLCILFLTLSASLFGLLYCIVVADPGGDRELVESLVLSGHKVEVYHLDRHDHTALEIFWGRETDWFANRYQQDHFSVDEIETTGNLVTIQEMFSNRAVVLDLDASVIVPELP